MSFGRWMDTQNVEHTCNGISFTLKKENSGTSYNTVQPWRYYLKINKSVTKVQILYIPLTWDA